MKRLLVLLCALWISACSGGESTTAPSTPPPSTPSLLTMTGRVTVAAPSTAVSLSGAIVRITDGPNTGKSATSLGDGAYVLAGLQPSNMSVRVTPPAGYEEYARVVGLSSTALVQNFQLLPTPTQIAETLNGAASGGGSGCSGTIADTCVSHNFAIHNTGTFDATLTWSGSADLDLYLFRVGSASSIVQSIGVGNSEHVSANISGGFTYQVKVAYYTGATVANYTLRLTHMN